MEHIIKQLKKGAKNARLSPAEKAEMRSALVLHMRINPALPGVHSVRFARSPFSLNNLRNKKGVSLLVISGLLISGSVSFAAEGAVPGDVLFPIKVRINEPVLGAVAVTPKAKADWQVRLVERRLEEVEKLAVMPEATPEVRQVAEQNLATYTEDVETQISKFDNDDDGDNAVQTASSLSNVYNAHEKILSRMNTKEDIGIYLVQATSTVEMVATSTVSLKKEESKNTLEKVRGAQNNAEKKRTELKKKYEKIRQNNNGGDATIQTATSTVETSVNATSAESTTVQNKNSHKKDQGGEMMSASVINANRENSKNEDRKPKENHNQNQQQNND